MDSRLLEIVIVSAKDLKNIRHITAMDVYIEATISGDPNAKQTTPVARDGGTKPTWNFPVHFTVDTAADVLRRSRPVLFLKLRCARSVRGDKDIGEAQVPIEDLLALSGGGTSARSVSYPVLMPNGKPRGQVHFSFKFGPGRDHSYPLMAIPYAVASPVSPHQETPPLGYPPVVRPQPPEVGNDADAGPEAVPPAEVLSNTVIAEILLSGMSANTMNANR